MPSKVLQLVAMGNVAHQVLKELVEPLRTQLGLSSQVATQPLGVPTYAFNKDRSQYHSSAILRRLTASLAGPEQMLLAVTDVDLFMPDSPFVFGEADRDERVAVASLFRMRSDADPKAALRRAQSETVHQGGHLIGLSYCEDTRCVMFFAQQPQDCDRRGVTLCNLCRNELAKIGRA